MKILISILVLIGLLSGCKDKQVYDDISIELSNIKLYLKEPVNADAMTPPIIFMEFNINNLKDDSILLSTKAWIGDDRKSRLLAIDTSNNVVIPIYSNSIPIIEGHNRSIIVGEINIRDIASHLNLDSNFFNKMDFSGDAKLLKGRVQHLMDNSIIIYISDTTDIKRYHIVNSYVNPIKTPIINVKKPNRLNFRNSD